VPTLIVPQGCFRVGTCKHGVRCISPVRSGDLGYACVAAMTRVDIANETRVRHADMRDLQATTNVANKAPVVVPAMDTRGAYQWHAPDRA
jgi:hypothetical protein